MARLGKDLAWAAAASPTECSARLKQAEPRPASRSPAAPESNIQLNIRSCIVLQPRHSLHVCCRPILENVEISEAAKALWEAPFAVLAHDG